MAPANGAHLVQRGKSGRVLHCPTAERLALFIIQSKLFIQNYLENCPLPFTLLIQQIDFVEEEIFLIAHEKFLDLKV